MRGKSLKKYQTARKLQPTAYMRGKSLKKYQTARSFFLTTQENLINKSRDVVSKSTANIYTSNKYDIISFALFYYWPITKHFST